MVSLKTLILIKMMTLWNYLVELCDDIIDRSYNLYLYIANYFLGHHETWLFIPGHTVPLSLNNLYNKIHVNWIYDNYFNSLKYTGENKDNIVHCKCSWLSTKIKITLSHQSDHTDEYDIDDFLEKLSIYTVEDFPPSLYDIFMSWCIYTKHWFKPDDIVEFHIIDDNGNEIILNLLEDVNPFLIRQQKIYIVINNEENEDNDNQDKNEVIDEAKIKDD